jgi:uncharacterized protein YbgA (DUF1722 family)
MLDAHSRTSRDALDLLIRQNKEVDTNLLFEQYGDILSRALSHPPTYISNIKVLLQAFGYFQMRLTPGEKEFFLASLERYRQGKVSICGPKNIIALWIARDGDKLLGNQTFLCHFPRISMNLIRLKLIGGVISGVNRAEKREPPRTLGVASSGGLGPACLQAGRQPMD